jgi:hypothetical protein
MSILLTTTEVERQSKQVFGQFGEKWRSYAKINVRLPHKSGNDLANCGVGKFMVLAAMGESLELNIEILRKYQRRVDILTCDKGFGTLLEQGIKPKYVMICDSNVPYKWLEPYIDDTEGITLIATPYANIEWTTKWKGDIYFYVSKDAINTEFIFMDVFGEDSRIIPASSNVSNTMLVYFLGVDDKTKVNFGGYEKYLLVGYDYGWSPTGNYYAFSNPTPKRYYMNHITMLDMNMEPYLTSENLLFSAKWMYSYLTSFNMPVINCSQRGLLDIPAKGNLEDMLKQINPDKSISKGVRKLFDNIYAMNIEYDKAMKNLKELRGGLTL